MIRWVNRKTINYNKVLPMLNDCVESHQFANFGKYVGELESMAQSLFKIDDKKKIVAVCNGACGISALVGAMNLYHGKELKFLVQGFTFPCSKQTLLRNSKVIDIDHDLDSEDLDSFDGIVITNCFGHCNNINYFQEFCKKNNKILLCDNAASPYTFYKGSNISNYGNGAMISLHHTKPIGFGEGGLVIIDSKYYDSLKRIICFGYSGESLKARYTYNEYASNYKMSELAAIYCIQWLDNFDMIERTHCNLYRKFKQLLSKIDATKVQLYPNYSDKDPFASSLPILFKDPVDVQYFIDAGIEAKKYYYPLSDECVKGHDQFARIIGFPLHTDMTDTDIEMIIDIIKKYIKSKCVQDS